MNEQEKADFDALKAELLDLKERLGNCEKQVTAARRLAEHMATRAEAFWDLLQSWKAGGP